MNIGLSCSNFVLEILAFSDRFTVNKALLKLIKLITVH